MADSDAPESADTFVQACGSPLGRIAAPPLHCTRPRGHDGDHADGMAGTWRDPDRGNVARLHVVEGGGIAGGSLSGKGGAGPSTDFARGFVMGGSLSGGSSAGGGSSTGFASGGPGGGSSQNPHGGSSTFVATGGVAGAVGGSAYAAGSYGGSAGGSAPDPRPRCGARSKVSVAGQALAPCSREVGHTGAHENDRASWSAAPPLGPVPERFRTMPRAPELEPFRAAVDAKPGLSEVLLAGLVACGRALGRIDGEDAERRRWQGVLAQTDGRLDQGERWSEVGPALFEQVKAVACSPPSEPSKPIQERAEALAILILRGQVGNAPPNALIRAGVAFEVLRSAWRKAKRGGT